jgi:RNA polymerase sigma-70 factor, ECF subfamily
MQSINHRDNSLENDIKQLFCDGLAGNQQRYALFLAKISPILRGFVFQKVPLNDMEDTVQEILISIHKARHTFDGERLIMPWLFAIARFRINDALRKLYAESDLSTSAIDFDQALEIFDTENLAQQKNIDQAISLNSLLEDAAICERDQAILALLYIEEYSAKEASLQLGMNESALKVAAHRAIKKIKEWVKS